MMSLVSHVFPIKEKSPTTTHLLLFSKEHSQTKIDTENETKWQN